jgi:hypothetical protein
MSTVYITDMKVAPTAASVRNLLLGGDWQRFTRPDFGGLVLPHWAREEFRKNGNSLTVEVSPVADNEQKSSVKYLIGAIGHRLPAPPDATSVEFDDARCLLRCSVLGDVKAVARYYVAAMADLGYETPSDFSPGEYKAMLVCTAKDHDTLVVDLNYEGQNTHVEIHGDTAADALKAESKAKPPRGN